MITAIEKMSVIYHASPYQADIQSSSATPACPE